MCHTDYTLACNSEEEARRQRMLKYTIKLQRMYRAHLRYLYGYAYNRKILARAKLMHRQASVYVVVSTWVYACNISLYLFLCVCVCVCARSSAVRVDFPELPHRSKRPLESVYAAVC